MNFIKTSVKDGAVLIGENKLDLKTVFAEKIAPYEGKDIVIGFRPESIIPMATDGAFSMKCIVELTEMLGDNTNVYVNIGDDKAILKVNPHNTPAMDSQMEFSVPYESVYLFDLENENRI